MIADKGYHLNGIRDSLEARGATPVIPGRANRKQPIPIDTFIYALRNRIERCFNKLNASDNSPPATTKPRQAISASSHGRKTLVRKFVNCPRARHQYYRLFKLERSACEGILQTLGQGQVFR